MDTNILQRAMDESPAIANMGLTVQLLDQDTGCVVIRMPAAAHTERVAGMGQYHGGPIALLLSLIHI